MMGGAEHAHVRALAVILPGGIDINAFCRQFHVRFRAIDASADEQNAVAASFAPSTVWATDVIETGADGSVVVPEALRESVGLDVLTPVR